MSSREEWVRAYARQSQADLEAWHSLAREPSLAECQRLQFLQMACEKLVKAHLCHAGSDPQTLQTSHAYVAKNLPIIVRQLVTAGVRVKNPDWLLVHVKHLAQEIELLAPAVRRGGQRPDNCEYPWPDDRGSIRSPLDWSFAPARLLLAPAGKTLLKLIRVALDRLIAGA